MLRHRFVGEASESGETLIEVLISSTLMAIVVVAIIGGIATMLLGSTVHREQASANTALLGAVEAIKAPDVARVKCATTGTYLPTAQAALPSGYSASNLTISSVLYQKIDITGGTRSVTWDSTCHDDGSQTVTLQLITMKVTSPSGRVSQSITFVKGDT
jgi:hypothetical protein